MLAEEFRKCAVFWINFPKMSSVVKKWRNGKSRFARNLPKLRELNCLAVKWLWEKPNSRLKIARILTEKFSRKCWHKFLSNAGVCSFASKIAARQTNSWKRWRSVSSRLIIPWMHPASSQSVQIGSLIGRMHSSQTSTMMCKQLCAFCQEWKARHPFTTTSKNSCWKSCPCHLKLYSQIPSLVVKIWGAFAARFWFRFVLRLAVNLGLCLNFRSSPRLLWFVVLMCTTRLGMEPNQSLRSQLPITKGRPNTGLEPKSKMKGKRSAILSRYFSLKLWPPSRTKMAFSPKMWLSIAMELVIRNKRPSLCMSYPNCSKQSERLLAVMILSKEITCQSSWWLF